MGDKKVSKSPTTIILEDILIRLDKSIETQQKYNEKVDSRLDAIEKEIIGVKKAVRFITKIIQIGSWIAAIVTAGLKLFAFLVPKAGK